MSFRDLPCVDCWYWAGFRIRCALLPNEPRLIEAHWSHGRQLVERGELHAWKMATTTLNLLLETACDQALPWHWRSLCLDHAYRSLYAVQHLAASRAQQQTLIRLRNRLATLQLLPSLSLQELTEGHSDD